MLLRLVGLKEFGLGTQSLGMGWPLSEVGTGWEQKMTCSSPHHLIIRACLPGPETGHYTHTHTHTGHQPARDPVEGGGGADKHPSTSKPPYARRLTQVQGRKSDGDGYNGVESRSRARQNRPVPPLTGLPGPKEVIWHLVPITPPHNTVWIWRKTFPLWTLGDLLGPPESGAKTEWLPQTSLPRHKGYNAGRPSIPDAIQHGNR